MSTQHVTSQIAVSQHQLRYDKRQVALIVKVAMLDRAKNLSDASCTSVKQLRAIAEGRMTATNGVLEYFHLQKAGDGFIWSFEA